MMKRWLSYLLIISLVLSGWMTAGAGQVSAQVNAGSIPELLITELVPDSTNVGTADGYEFIEVYNNTDQVIDFSNYKIRYRYLESDTLWAHEPDDVSIEPGGTLVFWIINTQNGNSTIADFNANYGTNLEENTDLVKIYSGGMSNSRMRELVVVSNTGHVISSAFYNDGEVQVGPDFGIFYKYPEDGSNRMVRISQLEHLATPGSLQHSQVPAQPVHIDVTSVPTLENLTEATAVAPGDDVGIWATAEDDRMVTTFTLSYRTDGQNDYSVVQLQEAADGFRHTIPFLELLGSDKLEYFFTASNGFNETISESYEVDLSGEGHSPRLNVSQDEVLSGQAYIRGAADGAAASELTLTIDGTEVPGTASLEHKAYLLFEADGINDAINTITIGRDILYHIPTNTNGYQTLVAPIEPQWLHGGINTIALRAGDNDKTYFEDDPPSGNLDDFNIRNVRLLLGDGTEIRDPRFTDPSLILDFGDDGRYYPVEYFEFEIPAEKIRALAYAWDTTAIADGAHTVRVIDPNGGEAAAQVLVDNHGPAIETSIVEGQNYKGDFVINVTAQDSISGVDTVQVLLDGKEIEVPYSTSSAQLEPGSHELLTKAVDKAGNVTERTLTFTTSEEHPDAPVLVSPADGEAEAGLSPELKVRVSDPEGDDLTVSFHQAHRYDALNTDQVSVYKNATDYEPPSEKQPAGEEALTAEELEQISLVDDQYVTVDSTTQFPYLRFQVELEDTVASEDTIEVSWVGKSLPGRKVTLYAWNHSTDAWTALTDHIAENEEDFSLTAEVDTASYVHNLQVDVLVQDEIPSREDYDYTFVWVSDTQFLTELYPHIHEQQFEWIVDSTEEMNIQYVFHTGDIVNDPFAEYQWLRASDYMKMFEDADLPYGVLAGNHDVGSYDWDYTTYSQYFGEDRYKDQPYYGGSYKDNRGHYDLISAEGNDFIMVYMGWGIEEEDIEWLNQVLAEHPDRMAFLNFHEYLRPNGTRSPVGDQLYNEVVVPNANVVAVLSGHFTGSNLLEDDIDDDGDGIPDRTVYQMLADYQGHAEGGMGYLRLLHFDTETGKVYVNTYSPYLDKYNYYVPKHGVDEFIIEMDLEPKVKRVATNYIDVKHLKAADIGTPQQAASGEEVSVTWDGLAAGETYTWYALAQDEYGGRTASDVWTFTTSEAAVEIDTPQNLRAESVGTTSAVLAWDAVAVPEGQSLAYNLYLDGHRHATVTESTYQVEGLAPGTAYQFTVTAADSRGNESNPSEPLTVITLSAEITVEDLRTQLEEYIASGDVSGPLTNQLSNRVKQVEHHLSKGNVAQAAKHLEDFLNHLNNGPMQRHVTEEAKQTLEQLANQLLEQWAAVASS